MVTLLYTRSGVVSRTQIGTFCACLTTEGEFPGHRPMLSSRLTDRSVAPEHGEMTHASPRRPLPGLHHARRVGATRRLPHVVAVAGRAVGRSAGRRQARLRRCRRGHRCVRAGGHGLQPWTRDRSWRHEWASRHAPGGPGERFVVPRQRSGVRPQCDWGDSGGRVRVQRVGQSLASARRRRRDCRDGSPSGSDCVVHRPVRPRGRLVLRRRRGHRRSSPSSACSISTATRTCLASRSNRV